MLDSDTEPDKPEVPTDDCETDFNLLEGPDDRVLLKLYLGKSNHFLELDQEEVDELRECLDEPPTPVRFRGDGSS